MGHDLLQAQAHTAQDSACRPFSPELLPAFFRALFQDGCVAAEDFHCTEDGFWAIFKSVADILICKGITTFPNSKGEIRDCANFFDDWYLYAAPAGTGAVYSLFKLREQEFDAENGLIADGDTPGVTVSFIALETDTLLRCISGDCMECRSALNEEINRVVAYPRQSHHPALKAYFNRPQAQAAYLIAELYTRHIARLCVDGVVDVPKKYAAVVERAAQGRKKDKRLPAFIDSNNAAAGRVVCDHRRIYLQDPAHLTVCEKYAILATHTANTSLNSFAAEVHYHARFLVGFLKFPIPFVGHSIYASAIRADMTIDDNELEGPAPFYNPNSKWLRWQREHHGTR